jgi:hypothetical protein
MPPGDMPPGDMPPGDMPARVEVCPFADITSYTVVPRSDSAIISE